MRPTCSLCCLCPYAGVECELFTGCGCSDCLNSGLGCIWVSNTTGNQTHPSCSAVSGDGLCTSRNASLDKLVPSNCRRLSYISNRNGRSAYRYWSTQPGCCQCDCSGHGDCVSGKCHCLWHSVGSYCQNCEFSLPKESCACLLQILKAVNLLLLLGVQLNLTQSSLSLPKRRSR